MIVTGEGKMANGLKAKTATFTIFLILATVLAMSCRECPTEQPDYDIYLSAEDVFSTSVVLSVTLPDSGDVSAFALDRDDSTVATYTCQDDDTLIINEGLTPDTDYIYRVRFLKDGKTKSESDPVSVHTMDTTSHDFIWEIDTLGNYGSYLKDAWIVDENNIWVVGNIETDSGEYNAARWNGIEWELMGIYSNTLDLYSIWYFSENDIWVTDYCSPIHWDGTTWTLYHLQNMGLDVCSGFGIWGTSSSNMYFVGLNGSIVHYDGSTFTKMESNTNIKLLNIHGTEDGEYVFIVGWDDSGKSIALQLHEGKVKTLYAAEHFVPDSNYGMVQSVAVIDNAAYFGTRAGLWKYKYLTEKSYLFETTPDGFEYLSIRDSRANSVNDIMFMDLWFTTFHFNGDTWYEDRSVLDIYGEWNIYAHGGDFKDDLVVLVGYCNGGSHAIVGRGHRN